MAGVGDVTGRAPRAVRLQVCLVDDVETVLVAQVQETGVVGVVAGTNRVDVELLAQAHVRHHVLHRHRSARARIELVAVDTAEDKALAVEHEDRVEDFEAAEATR